MIALVSFVHRRKPVAPVVYSSGNPRMLLVLCEFESRRGQISNLFANGGFRAK